MKVKEIFELMKLIALVMAANGILGACQSELTDDGGEDAESEKVEVVFDLKTDDKANTRTIDLADVDGLSLVMMRVMNERHDDRITCTDGNYGNMTFRVPLGLYNVHAVATDAPDYEFDEDFIVLPNGGNIWYARTELNVRDTGKEMIVPVELKRMNSKIVVTPLDEIPENCKSITMTLKYGDDAMGTIGGGILQDKILSKTVEIPESYKGTIGKLSLSMYTLLRSFISSVTLGIQATDEDGAVIGQVKDYTVTIKRNQQAYIKGYLFSSKVNGGMTIEYDWDDNIIYQW